MFGLLALFLTSCGGAGEKPEDYITFGQAWNHVSQSFGYWIWIVVTGIALAVLIWGHQREKWLPSIHWYFVAIALFLAAWLVRPAEVAQNTTVEQASRGVYIGY